MNSSLYIGATGLKGLAENMGVVSNNIANVNTVGYKQQSMFFSDLICESQGGMGGWWGAQEGTFVAMGQMGKGVQVDSVRTLFTNGDYEIGIETTDLSISGKGFFEVTTLDGEKRYTRAGNYRFDNAGFLRLPDSSTLTGYPIATDGTRGEARPIQVDMVSSPAKGTTAMTLTLNLDVVDDSSASATDPYFGMVQAWNGTTTPPLGTNSYGYTQSLRIYDTNGNPQDLNIYFDGTPDEGSGNKTVEFVVGRNAPAPAQGGDMLMAGTLTFNSSGQIVNMSAFIPSGGAQNDLSSWVPATLINGVPQFTMDGQSLSLTLGISAPTGWNNTPATAADVGTSSANLPSMGTPPTRSANATTGYAGSSAQRVFTQDGYAEGVMNGLEIRTDGSMIASFTNGQSQKIYEIPLCRFTSEDGLRREGNNLFSISPEAGQMEMGRGGTENYGVINAHTLETSNVDMAREMVNMIITQRGFQSNSKVITTADAMLQKALELKR